MIEHLQAIDAVQAELGIEFVHIVPVSAESGTNLNELADLIIAELPQGPAYYPDGEITDEPDETLIAELIREAALEGYAMSCRTRSSSPSRRCDCARDVRRTARCSISSPT